MKSKAFYSGYQDFAYGKTTNPHIEGTDDYEAWQDGFDMAEDDEAALEYNRKHTRRGVQRAFVADGSE